MHLRLLFTFISSFSTVVAQETGDEVFRFLNLPASARLAAFGSKAVALPSPDLNALFSNPALLSGVKTNTAAVGRTDLFADVNLSSVVFFTTIKTQPVAFSVRWLSYGDLSRISETGEILGDISAYDAAFGLATFRKLTEELSFGVDLNYVQSRYADVSASALAFTSGLFYRNDSQKLTAGLTINNAGRQLRGFYGEGFNLYRKNDGQELPFDIRFSMSKRPEYVPIELFAGLHSLHKYKMEIASTSGNETFFTHLSRHAFGGAELLLSDHLIARIGFDKLIHDQHKSEDQFDSAGLSFGLGLKIRRFQIDFARRNYSNAGNIFQFAVQASL